MRRRILASGHPWKVRDRATGIDMVLVLPGEFLMGSPESEAGRGSDEGPQDERPQHKVQLAAYWIDRTPVTNNQFAQFLNAIGPRGPQGETYYDIDDNDYNYYYCHR